MRVLQFVVSVVILALVSSITYAQVFDDSGNADGINGLDTNKVIRDALKAQKVLGLSDKLAPFLCEVTSTQSVMISWDEEGLLHFSELLSDVRTGKEFILNQPRVVSQNGDILIYNEDDLIAMLQPRLWKWYFGTFLVPFSFADEVGKKLNCSKL